MATVKDVMSLMEEIAPLTLSEMYCKAYNSYDNSGLIIGDEDKQIFTVLCCLDLTSEVAVEAADINADMVITHHPFIFSAIKNVTKDNPTGKTLYSLIKNDIAVYSAHLNLDVAPYGINQIFADKLGLTNCLELEPLVEDAGLGRVGDFYQPKTLNALVAEITDMTGDYNIKSVGDLSRQITKAAVVCGAGGGDIELLKKAQMLGAELFITSEIKHHVALYANEINMAMIDAGHYATENLAIPVICDLLNDYAEDRNLDIEFVLSEVNANPFNITNT